MDITVRGYRPSDIPGMVAVWNQVIETGTAFPWYEGFDETGGAAYFSSMDYNAVAVDEDDRVVGLYTLHPNNVDRCGHIANTSIAVDTAVRGRGIGELLLRDCLEQAAAHGFRVMQFNSVVASNTYAQRLYDKVGFTRIGRLPGGFLMPDGHYEDVLLYYHEL